MVQCTQTIPYLFINFRINITDLPPTVAYFEKAALCCLIVTLRSHVFIAMLFIKSMSSWLSRVLFPRIQYLNAVFLAITRKEIKLSVNSQPRNG